MTQLEQLRQLVNGWFDKATDKDQIDFAAKLNNSIDSLETEQKQLTDKNAELIKDYKTLVQHTSFSAEQKQEEISGSTQYDLDAAISKAFSTLK